jgi:replicative DNA helicase
MSAGLRLILSICKEQSRVALAEITTDLLVTNEEKELFRFLKSYVQRHHSFPKIATLRKRFGYLSDMRAEEVHTYYMDEVFKRALYNSIRDPYASLGELFQGANTDIAAVISKIEELSYVCRRFSGKLNGSGVDDSVFLLDKVLEEFEDSILNHGLKGVPTGWGPVDAVTGGYKEDDLVFWIGRPSRGKSFLLLKQAYEAWMAGYKVLWISMEMGGLQSMRRMVGIHSRVNPNLIRSGEVSTMSVGSLRNVINEMKEKTPLYMVTANFDRTVNQVNAYIEQFLPDAVYIDAAYLLTPEKKRTGSGSRRETIADVVEELKKTTSDAKRPLVCTVQFNRQADQAKRSVNRSPSVRINPIAHLSLDKIGETDVIGQAGSVIFGMDSGLSPYEKETRAFGFLKGREGEDGWWYCNYPPTATSPIDLSLLEPDDPRIEVMERPSARQPAANPQEQETRRNMLSFMR